MDYLTNGKVTRAVQSAHTLNILLAQYATDNNDVYPVGEGTSDIGTSKGIARNLLENHFTPDASIFAVGSTVRYNAAGEDYSKIAAANISWDFTGGPTASTGITTMASDLLPTLYTTGESVAYPTTAGTGFDLTLSGNGPFGKEGVVVAYKNNTAKFIAGVKSETGAKCPGFIRRNSRPRGRTADRALNAAADLRAHNRFIHRTRSAGAANGALDGVRKSRVRPIAREPQVRPLGRSVRPEGLRLRRGGKSRAPRLVDHAMEYAHPDGPREGSGSVP